MEGACGLKQKPGEKRGSPGLSAERLLDGLAAGFAACGGKRDVREALRAGFAGSRFWPFESREQLLGGKNEAEVDDRGEDEEIDAGVDKAAVANHSAVDVSDKAGEIGPADDGRDERADDVTDERFSYIGKGCTNNKCDGKIHHIAAKDEIAKAFNHFWSPWCSR